MRDNRRFDMEPGTQISPQRWRKPPSEQGRKRDGSK